MHNKESYYRTALIAVLSLLSFVGVMMEVRSPVSVSPVKVIDPLLLFWGKEVSKVEKTVGGWLDILHYWNAWDKERLRLIKERDGLLVKLNAAKAALIENNELRRLLRLKREIPYPVVPVDLICKGGTPWSPTFLVDKGSKDGIGRGMAVVSPYGVWGWWLPTRPIPAGFLE
jgi:cell shape-determining protein MreC